MKISSFTHDSAEYKIEPPIEVPDSLAGKLTIDGLVAYGIYNSYGRDYPKQIKSAVIDALTTQVESARIAVASLGQPPEYAANEMLKGLHQVTRG